jgi:DNA polymerase I-like protein with 3'-5' exonuclease and polymerase domains
MTIKNIIITNDQLDEMVEHYLAQDSFAFDVETVGDRRGDTPINEVLWISFATHGRCDVIPMGHPNGDILETTYPLTGQGEKRVQQGLPARPSDYSKDAKKSTKVFSDPPVQLFPAEVFNTLKPLMFSPTILKIAHNLVFDLTSVAKYYGGQIPVGPYFDTMVASFIYDNRNKNKCGLADSLKRELGFMMEKGVGAEVEKYSFKQVANYAYLDAKYTFLLWKKLVPKLEENQVTNVMALEMDVLKVLCDMKLTGAPIDISALTELDERLKTDIEIAKAEIFKVAGKQFNINSNVDKQQILYSSKSEGGRGLTSKITTATGNDSVSAEALEVHRGQDPLVDALLIYTDLNKLHSTYVVPYLGGQVIRTTGGKSRSENKDSLLINNRIHCDFIQHGAETGRFSSRNPNLQNVPAPHTEHGKAIRNLFRAPNGYKFVVADYSQIEPRVIASFSKDPIMIENYKNGGDIYTTVGKEMGVDRKAGKVLVLAMSYGVGPDKISRQIGCTKQEAKDLLERFSDRFPSIGTYKTRVLVSTKKLGQKEKPVPYVTTVLGRRRYLPEMNSSDKYDRSGAERQAFNTKIQGSAADIIKLAMVRAHSLIPKESKLILTVHDELVTLAPDHLVDETAEAIRSAMEGINMLEVPLVADIKIVERWGEAKDT